MIWAQGRSELLEYDSVNAVTRSGTVGWARGPGVSVMMPWTDELSIGITMVSRKEIKLAHLRHSGIHGSKEYPSFPMGFMERVDGQDAMDAMDAMDASHASPVRTVD